MFLIPLQHFLAADKPFVYGSVGGYLYLVIDLFVMQVFFFLSGYFSKNAARGRQIAAGTLLWPVIVMWLACGLVRVAGFAIPIRLYRPPYAMWFLLCLFYYRMFQTAYLKIPHLAGVVFVLGLLIGLVPFIGRDFALARATFCLAIIVSPLISAGSGRSKAGRLRGFWRCCSEAYGCSCGMRRLMPIKLCRWRIRMQGCM